MHPAAYTSKLQPRVYTPHQAREELLIGDEDPQASGLCRQRGPTAAHATLAARPSRAIDLVRPVMACLLAV
eukprot:3021225-Pleurochrysis_carterae.AAC.4